MPRGQTMPLHGGVAVITGAASGIGAALALALARERMGLALADVDETGLSATAQRARAEGAEVSLHAFDITDAAAIEAFPAAVQAAHGRVSVLVNNAGVALGGRFEQVDAADFDWLMAVNFFGTVRMTRAFLPLLARERVAQLVNVSSVFGLLAPPGQTAYCASKFAVRGFSESLRHELASAGSPVGVTLVHPGGVRTAIADNARPARGLDPTEVARERAAWRELLALDADEAAHRIVHGIVAREPRVLVGRDAVAAAWLQRLFPVSYWRHMARDIERRVRRGSAGRVQESR